MEPSDDGAAGIEQIVRGLTAAAKALRLYPPSSPIPRQAVEATAAALHDRLAGEPVLALKVGRDGLEFVGQVLVAGAPGALDLAGSLRDHGVAEIAFTPGVTIDELIAFLTVADAKPDELRARGGIAAALMSDGVEHIRATAVTLTIVDASTVPVGDEEPDSFLRDLAADPDRVSTWLSVAVKTDPETLANSLADLAAAVGDENVPGLLDALASGFGGQAAGGQDALIGLAVEEGPARGLLAGMLARVPAHDVANSLACGSYGRNMLSLSSALSRLPLADRFSDVMSKVNEILPTLGHDAKELAFLEHMIEVRTSPETEPVLADAQPVYRKIADLASVDPGRISRARDEVVRTASRADEAAVGTLLRLLDQQSDFGLYCGTLESLAGMVPVLIERRQTPLAGRVITELTAREAREVQPWPELTGKLRAAIAEATGRRAMKALVAAAAADRNAVPIAREILHGAGEVSQATFVEEALAVKPDGLAVAELVVGRRLVDMLAAAAARVPWYQVSPLVAVLGRESDSRAQVAIGQLVHCGDEQSRREVAAGLAIAGGPGVVRHLATLLRDPSSEVAISATRALGEVKAPGASTALAQRLAEMDVDSKDFAVAREVIGALARRSDAVATEAITTVANRRSLMKRGHFVEITQLARQALEHTQGGAR